MFPMDSGASKAPKFQSWSEIVFGSANDEHDHRSGHGDEERLPDFLLSESGRVA